MSAKKSENPDFLRKSISDRANSLSPSGIRKFFDLLASMDDVISLGVGEPDYATPWHISEAAVRSLEKGYTMYTSNSGMPDDFLISMLLMLPSTLIPTSMASVAEKFLLAATSG